LARAEFLGDVHPDDQPAAEALIQDTLSGGAGRAEAELRLVRKDGETVAVRLWGSVIRPPGGEPYFPAFVADISGARQAAAQISRLHRELVRSRRLASLGQLVSGISHDFANMLTVIGNYASLVRDEVVVAEAADGAARWGPVRWDVEQISDAADRARRLIQHLLAFARREEDDPVLVDLGQMVANVNGLLGEVLGEHVQVTAEPAAGLWPVQADPALLEQALINIAVNARDAMPSGGQVTITAANIDAADPACSTPGSSELLPGRYVELCISDTGTGMDAVTAERAFEPFFTTKSGGQAAGLGLPAVRALAAQAGGDAWLRSQPGKGTTVTMMLPAAAVPGIGPDARHPAGHAGQAGTILVADDEAAIREVAHRILASAGYQVITAADGPQALSVLRDPQIRADLVLADVVMPGMTAQTFAAQAHAARPGIQLLFMSGYQEHGSGLEGWPAAAQVIGKPFSRAALLARVTYILASTTTHSQAAQQAAIPAAQRPPA
jgi:hypothetical protein